MDKKVLPLDEYGRQTAGERYGKHSTSEHGRMAMNKGKVRPHQMDTGGATPVNRLTDPANYPNPTYQSS